MLRYTKVIKPMTEPYESRLNAALAELQAASQSLASAISDYPTPIVGCDAQFIALLADRTRVNRAIVALNSRPFVPTPRETEPASRVESR